MFFRFPFSDLRNWLIKVVEAFHTRAAGIPMVGEGMERGVRDEAGEAGMLVR